MKNLKIALALFILSSISLQILSQERTIVGKVIAFESIPLNNIKVLSKKSGNETLTDKNGNFKIICFENDVLSFNSVCFDNVKKKMKNEKDTISVNLFFINTLKNKEMAAYNQYIEEKTLEQALINLPNRTTDYSKYTDIYQLIKCECPNVQVVNNQIIVPPLSTINGNKEVLMVVDDNYVTDVSFVQPNTVLYVKVLKGSETSPYGLRGSNGVLVIKTFGKIKPK